MTLAYAVERFDDALPEGEKFIAPQWEEVGSFADHFDKQINFAEYRALDAAGRLLSVTARNTDRLLVGYFVGTVSNDRHRITRTNPPRHVGVCTALIYYMDPAYRGHARGFIRACEGFAAARGCSIMNIRVKDGRNGAREFLAALRYVAEETAMVRIIGAATNAPLPSRKPA